MSFQDLIPIDNDKIIFNEKLREQKLAKKLAKDTEDLKLIMVDLNNIIKDSNIPINEIDNNVEASKEVLKETTIELTKAKKYQGNTSILKIAGICTLAGVCLGGPLGAIGGSYLGLAIGGGIFGTLAGGSIAGGTAYGVTKKKQKNQELKEKLLDYDNKLKDKIKDL